MQRPNLSGSGAPNGASGGESFTDGLTVIGSYRAGTGVASGRDCFRIPVTESRGQVCQTLVTDQRVPRLLRWIFGVLGD